LTTPATAQKFGAYEILYELKSGGMGAVLLGRRRGPGAFEQLVAIKTIRPEHARSEAVRAMFLDEAAILARLNHPGIAHVHDFGEEGGTLYMVMEYVAGIAFREVAELAPPAIVVARAIAEACRGLHAAHEARDLAGTPLGLVHRDISPDNLMLGYDGHVKVIDFGIALVKNRQAPVTEFGMLKGKPPYMSPEQVKNEPMDRRSDVFSLGVVTWEMLARQTLFDGDSIYAIAIAVQDKQIDPPSRALGEPLPIGLDAVVMNALDRDLERRTKTAAAFAEDLEQVVQATAGETLAAWTERALGERREAHRAWLAEIVGGGTQLPRAIGRPTGLVTEIAADPGRAKTGVAPATPVAAYAPVPQPGTQSGAADEPGPGTSIGRSAADDDRLDAVPRRSLALPVIVLLLVLAAGGFAVYVATRAPATAPVAPRDAAVAVAHPLDASPPIVQAPADAPMVVAELPPEDAAPPPTAHDAGVHHAIHVPRDAAAHVAVAAPIDAAVAPAANGTAYLLAKHHVHYLNVLVDGQQIGVTPILGKGRSLHAGKHRLELVDPQTSEVVVDKTIDLRDGETFTLEP